ncbi:hypothetical protein H5410_016349 [Solanum commersonii]|uniref:Uncharacterized protein n=1 Tax=Solanum commersonii TaxID=4109 RepID=A0A9J5ZW08_SOLCO|nr:hypothetical protein H5410_016349 [Solanum commersonii]
MTLFSSMLACKVPYHATSIRLLLIFSLVLTKNFGKTTTVKSHLASTSQANHYPSPTSSTTMTTRALFLRHSDQRDPMKPKGVASFLPTSSIVGQDH